MALLNFSQNSIRSEPQFDRFGEVGFAKTYIRDRYSRNTLPSPHLCDLEDSETLGELGRRRRGRRIGRAVKRVGRVAVRAAIPVAATVVTGGAAKPVAARQVAARQVAARTARRAARRVAARQVAVRRPVAARAARRAAAVRPRPVTRPVAVRPRPVAAGILPVATSVLPVAARTRPEFDPGIIPRPDIFPDYAPSRIPERDAEMRQPSFDPVTGELIATPVKRDKEFPWKWVLLGLGGFLLITSLSQEKEKRIRGK